MNSSAYMFKSMERTPGVAAVAVALAMARVETIISVNVRGSFPKAFVSAVIAFVPSEPKFNLFQPYATSPVASLEGLKLN